MQIRTQRCLLKPYNLEDIPAILEMMREPDSNKYIQPLRDGDENFILGKLKRNAEENKNLLQYWSVYALENNDFVGTLNLNKFANTGLDQLGVHLSQKYWGQGYGREVCEAVMSHAFQQRKQEKIHWIIETEHDVSRRLAKGLGFKPFKKMNLDGCDLEIFVLKNPISKA
jgi:RimJ/RimL family protein N-acetyltransferase